MCIAQPEGWCTCTIVCNVLLYFFFLATWRAGSFMYVYSAARGLVYSMCLVWPGVPVSFVCSTALGAG